MKNYIVAEYIKGKRSFSHFFFLGFPMIVVLLCIPFSRFMYFDINFFIPLIYNWCPTLFLPLGLSVLAYQSIQREKETRTYNYYYLLNKKMFWKTKIITLVLYSFLANLFIAVLSIALEFIMYNSENILIINVILTSLILWISTLFIIPFSILLAKITTPIVSIIINSFGMLVSILIATGNYWYLCPWAWSLRMIIPIIKTKPNGLLVEESDPLNSISVLYPGLGLAVLIFIILYISVPLILSRTKEDK